MDRDPSAITASSGGSKEWRREPARTQCGSEELRAADLYDDQCLQQQTAGFEVDQSSMVFFVIAKLIQDSSVLDENHLEGWVVAWNLIVKHLEMPLS